MRKTAEEQASTSDLVALLGAVSRRDQSAMAELYDNTVSWVHGLVKRILSDPDIAEETTLDVYLQVWQKAQSYSPQRGSPLAWLLTMARSRAIDRLRSMASRRRHEGSFSEALEPRATPQTNPETRTMFDERRQHVSAALAKLPDQQKRSIELAYFQGLSHTEIATRLEMPLGTIKSQIRLGMMKLRSLLRPCEDAL